MGSEEGGPHRPCGAAEGPESWPWPWPVRCMYPSTVSHSQATAAPGVARD